MKIHIAQKGDTLHKIATKYGVGVNDVKTANSQLSNPDLIMPGMKIKVPPTGAALKKNSGAGAASPKEYVMGVQAKEPASELQLLGVEEEDEPVPQAETVTDQPAMQQPAQKEYQMPAGQKEYQMPAGQKEYQMPAGQKEYQMPAGQKEYQMPAGQKETQIAPVQKETPVAPIQKEAPAPPVQAPAAKPPAPSKDTSKFSVNILPQPPKPPAKGFNVANEFKIGGAEKKSEKPSFTAPAAAKSNVAQPADKSNVAQPADKSNSNFNFAANKNQAVSPAANKENTNTFNAPIAAKPAAEKSVPIPISEQPNVVAPAVNKANMTAPAMDVPNKGLPPVTNTPADFMQQASMPNLFPTADKSLLSPAANKEQAQQTAPAFHFPNIPQAPFDPMSMPQQAAPFDPMSMPQQATPFDPMSMPQQAAPFDPMSMPQQATPFNPMSMPQQAAPFDPVSMPQYAAPFVMPAYDQSLPMQPNPMMYGQPSYAPQPYPQYAAPYPYAPSPYPQYGIPAPYAPMPYPQYGMPAYQPMPYPEGYVQGAYAQPDPSGFIPQPQYESSSLYMPSGATNNAPAFMNPQAGQEDCGCDGPPAYATQPTMYAPQPGGMYGQPYYPTYPQAAYYQSMPYVPYAPQPGAPYYRPEQASMFGVPNVEEDED